ncbi:hypothetical protein [Psychroserpens sp. MEBiC05023]
MIILKKVTYYNKIFHLCFLLSLFLFACKSKTINAKTDIDSKNFKLTDVAYAKKQIYVGELNTDQLKLLKTYLLENFDKNIDSLHYISISYLKPRNVCWYNNYAALFSNSYEKTTESIKSKMNSELLFIHSEPEAPKTVSYFDNNQFIYKLFDKGLEACDFSVTIDYKGNFLFKAGHFDVKVLNAFRNELENFNTKNSN